MAARGSEHGEFGRFIGGPETLHLDEFQLRWLNIKAIDAAFLISLTLFSNHLK